MKYVILKSRESSIEFPLIFSSLLKHNEAVASIIERGFDLVSAGFVVMHEGVPQITAEKSVSLGIGPRAHRDQLLMELEFKRVDI